MSLSSKEAREWLDRVRTYFNEEIEKDIDSNVCVFRVPKSLSSARAEAYAPQLVGLGPYHHLQPELREMERVKLDVVKKLHKEFNGSGFLELARKLSPLHLYVRACYHKFLDIDADALSWIMTIDGLFLFHVLLLHAISEEILKATPSLRILSDQAGKKLAKDAVLRDVMMLENQIPIFFLERMVKVGCAPLEAAEQRKIEENFPRMLVGFCKALSPFEENDDHRALKPAHLLDLLYSMVVRREEEFKIDIPDGIISVDDDPESPDVMSNVPGRAGPPMASVTMATLKNLKVRNLSFKDKIKPHALIMQTIMSVFSEKWRVCPAEEKGLIPTASSLARAGVKFRKTSSIEGTSFEERTHAFQLPAIKVGVNSEVVIRNLVAYEAMAISGPLVLARFMEIMDGLVETLHDVRLLREHCIIKGHLKDDEVTRLFSGVSHSLQVHCHCQQDKTIKKVNKFYNATLSIKTRNMIDRYVYGAWKVLVMAATLLFFLLTALQTFCSAYKCSSLAIFDELNSTWPHSPHVVSPPVPSFHTLCFQHRLSHNVKWTNNQQTQSSSTQKNMEMKC